MSELLARWSARELMEIGELLKLEKEEQDAAELEAKAGRALERAKAMPR